MFVDTFILLSSTFDIKYHFFLYINFLFLRIDFIILNHAFSPNIQLHVVVVNYFLQTSNNEHITQEFKQIIIVASNTFLKYWSYNPTCLPLSTNLVILYKVKQTNKQKLLSLSGLIRAEGGHALHWSWFLCSTVV